MYKDTLKGDHKELHAYVDYHFIVPEDRPRPLNEWIWRYADRRAAKRIWFLGITKDSIETRKANRIRKKQKRKLRFIQDNFEIPAKINIYGDRVAIFFRI